MNGIGIIEIASGNKYNKRKQIGKRECRLYHFNAPPGGALEKINKIMEITHSKISKMNKINNQFIFFCRLAGTHGNINKINEIIPGGTGRK